MHSNTASLLPLGHMACEHHLARCSGQCITIELHAVAVSARPLQHALRASIRNVRNHRCASAVSRVRSVASAYSFAVARYFLVGQRAALGCAALSLVLPNLALNRTLRDKAAHLRLAHVGHHDNHALKHRVLIASWAHGLRAPLGALLGAVHRYRAARRRRLSAASTTCASCVIRHCVQ